MGKLLLYNMALEKLGDSLSGVLRKISRAGIIDERLVKEVIKDIQRALLSADVNVKLVMKISKKIQERALKEKPKAGLGRKEHIITILYEELSNLLGSSKSYSLPNKSRILMVGLQGSGKTTTTVKLARYFSKRGLSTSIIAADTYRPAAYEQLFQLAEPFKIRIYGEPENKNAIEIVKHGLQELNTSIVILDTAGRHRKEEDLFKEMREINKKFKPDEKFLVIDSNIGQQAGAQAKAFHESIGITGVILTKLDGSARGGGALSAVAETGAPVRFIGVGEKMGDLEVFNPERFISRILGMGDLQTLLEKAKDVLDEKKAKEMLKGDFTLDDLYEQLQSIKKMGPLNSVLSMIPGMGMSLPKEASNVTEEKFRKFLIIMDSMTVKERAKPKIINASRMKRVARGAGSEPEDVKELMNYYKLMHNAFKGFGKRGMKRGFSPGALSKIMKGMKF
ncbi:signal recognition particle protein [archaeon]|nr:signal recognition particle protein [archaeon]